MFLFVIDKDDKKDYINVATYPSTITDLVLWAK